MGYAASAERVVLWDMWPWLRELYFVVYGASAERVVLLLCLLPSYCRVTIITCDSVYSGKQQNSQTFRFLRNCYISVLRSSTATLVKLSHVMLRIPKFAVILLFYSVDRSLLFTKTRFMQEPKLFVNSASHFNISCLLVCFVCVCFVCLFFVQLNCERY